MLDTAIGLLSVAGLLVIGLLARVLLGVLIIAAVVTVLAALVYGWILMGAAVSGLLDLERVGHVRWRRGRYYTPEHVWLQPRRRGRVRLGLDDLAQRLLPDVSAVHLLPAGTQVTEGQPIGLIECPGGDLTLRAPIAGEVRAVNVELERQPGILHADPYGRAWVVEMQPADTRYRQFAAGEIARRWFKAEDQRLASFLEGELGVAAADGGELILPPHQLLAPEQWKAARTRFLG